MREYIREHRWAIATLLGVLVLIVLFTLFLGPHELGDSPTYLSAVNVLSGGTPDPDFFPNRIITTFIQLELIRALAPVVGSILNAWFFMNCLMYIAACMFFFLLLERFFKSGKTAFLGTLFLSGNYGFFVFSLNYSMDIGGWLFYIAALYFLWTYAQSKRPYDLYTAAAMIGVGGLFKEYAFLAAIALALYVVIDDRTRPGLIFRKAITCAGIAAGPALVLYAWAYSHFGYSYLDWFGANVEYYVYRSRILEFVKALGSLHNLLAVIFVGGLIAMRKQLREDSPRMIFLVSVLISVLPIFFWPAITQRILAVTVPFVCMIACFVFQRYERQWYWFLAVFAAYLAATCFMDSYILTSVNLPF